MRILHVLGSLNRGGAETWLVQVLRHIDRQKYQMDFLVHSAEPGAYDDEVRALGSRILPCLEPSNPLRYAYNFRRILRQYGPYDCVHSHVHLYSGYVLLLAAIMGVPIRIAQSHSDTRVLERGASPIRKGYIAAMKALIEHCATRGIAVSENAAASLFSSSWKSDSRWSLCPLGIDMRPFAQEVDSQKVRGELGISANALVVGHVGRFCEVKNHRFLVEVAECLCRLEPRAMFLLVGDGPLQSELKTLVQSRGLAEHFVFTGVRADVPRLMKGAMDCFLLPSFYEGLPLALLEAQAAGIGCVVSDTVSSEGDLGGGAVTHLPLTSSPCEWAAQLLTVYSRKNRFVIAPDWIRTRSVDASAERTASLYQPRPNIDPSRLIVEVVPWRIWNRPDR